MNGKHDAANAIVQIKPGAGGTDACDWAEIMYACTLAGPRLARLYVEIRIWLNEEAGIQSVTFRVVGTTPLVICKAKLASSPRPHQSVWVR